MFKHDSLVFYHCIQKPTLKKSKSMYLSLQRGVKKNFKKLSVCNIMKSAWLYFICILTIVKIWAGGSQCLWCGLCGVLIPASWCYGHHYAAGCWARCCGKVPGADGWRRHRQSASCPRSSGCCIPSESHRGNPCRYRTVTRCPGMLQVRVAHPTPAAPQRLLPSIKIQVWPSPVDLIIF